MDRSAGMRDGVANSIPPWCVEFFSSFAWTRARLLALCLSLPCPLQHGTDPGQLFHPAFVKCDMCMPQNNDELSPSTDEVATGVSVDEQAMSAPSRPKLTKFGRCDQWGSARRPWIYKSGTRAGQAHYVCNRLFAKKGKKCFRSQLMCADDIANMSSHFRREHSSLVQRFKRAGRADVQARSSRV